jgi:hypothetical protein
MEKWFGEHPSNENGVWCTKILYALHTHGKSWEKTTSFILSNESTFLA